MNKLALLILLVAVSFKAVGHDVSKLLQQCALEKNALKRLVCFDEISQHSAPSPKAPEATKQVEASPAQPSKKTTQATPVKTIPAKEFGLEHKPKLEELADSIVANVVSIKKDPYKKYIITLDNGHVWKQSDSTRLKLTVGEDVIVKRGLLGSFFMGKEGKNKRMRVKRLR